MKIILIDDDSTSNSLNKMLFQCYDANIQVTAFDSAFIALDFIHENKDLTFDLIIIDLEMRDLDGWQTVEALNLHQPCCPNIVILTAYLSQKEIDTAQSYSTVKATLKKPLTLNKISELVHLI